MSKRFKCELFPLFGTTLKSELKRKAETTGHSHWWRRNAIQCFLPTTEYPLADCDCIHHPSVHRHLNREFSAPYKVFLSCPGITQLALGKIRLANAMLTWLTTAQPDSSEILWEHKYFLGFKSLSWNYLPFNSHFGLSKLRLFWSWQAVPQDKEDFERRCDVDQCSCI